MGLPFCSLFFFFFSLFCHSIFLSSGLLCRPYQDPAKMATVRDEETVANNMIGDQDSKTAVSKL